MFKTEAEGAFFVGYLPTPATSKRFLKRALLVLIVIIGGLALLLAAGQRDPGDGVWDLDEIKSLEGVVAVDPCPLIRVNRPGEGAVTVLVVSEGKVGARERLEGMSGRVVRLNGHILQRGAVMMLESDDGAEAIKAMDNGSRRNELEKVVWGGDVVLQGELVDPKCFAGAMKPGEGKTHKACAVLCIRGGIPALFMAVEEGKSVPYLVVDAQGKSPRGDSLERLLPYVGDWTEVHGRAGRLGNLRVLEILADGIHRR